MGCHRAAGELGARLLGQGAEPVVVEVVERRADDAAGRHQTGAVEVQQARQQLALGEVPGGAEQHDDVRAQRRHQVRRDVAGVAHRAEREAPAAARRRPTRRGPNVDC